jgi:hypothetical protein
VVRRPSLKLLFLLAGIMALCWLPYVLSNIPGGVFYDNYLVYDIVWGRKDMTNQQPILYTWIHILLYKLVVILLDGTMQTVVIIMTILQYTALAFGLSWFVCWLRLKAGGGIFSYGVWIFFCLFPLFPGYAISNWKDTLFSLFLFLFAVTVADICLDGTGRFCEKRWLIRYITLSLLVCFFRNNGIYIIIASTILLLLAYRKEIFGGRRIRFPVFAAIAIIATIFIQGPVFDRIGYNVDQEIEMDGIPLQQICSIILSGGVVREVELAFVDQIVSPQVRETYFSPNGIDPVKRVLGSKERLFLKEHQSEFLRVWANIVARNPGQAMEAYLITTLGFWDVAKSASHGYVQTTLAQGWEWQGLTPHDLIDELTGHSVYSRLLPKYYISAALFGWIALFCAVLILLGKNHARLLAFAPMLLLWATVMVSTPIAYSLRYIFALVPFVPLALFLCFSSGVMTVAKAGSLTSPPMPPCDARNTHSHSG